MAAPPPPPLSSTADGDGPLSARLWREAAPVVAALGRHPFLVALADGTLPRERFA